MTINPYLLSAFLRDYLFLRQPHWEKYVNKLLAYVRDDKANREDTCNAFNAKFYNLNSADKPGLAEGLHTVEGLVKLLYELGNAGRENLLISSTLHAIRTYILAKIYEEIPETEEQKDIEQLNLQITFNQYVETLRQNTDIIAANIRNLQAQVLEMRVNSTSRMDVDNIKNLVSLEKAKYHANLLQLADLGHYYSICEASEEGLFRDPTMFPDLLKDTPINGIHISENIPYFYHWDFYLIHFERYYRSLDHVKVSFDEYEKRENSADIIPPKPLTPSTSTGMGFFDNIIPTVTSYFSTPSNTPSQTQ